jgi:hypothetical protein
MAFEAYFPFTRMQVFRWRRLTPGLQASPVRPVLERAGRVYDEETFDYCLRLEHKRAALTGLPYFLVLISPRPDPAGKRRRIPRSRASDVFEALEGCVREIDSVGWYRDGRIAGAVLPQGSESASSNGARVVAARISDALLRRLPRVDAKQLRVRVLHLGCRSSNPAPCQEY